MGFLDHIWDETLAGPAPDSGLGRIRKFNSFSAVRTPNHPLATSRLHGHVDDHASKPAVSRSITILRPTSLCVNPGSRSGSSSGPSSPCLSSGPSSPFSPITPIDEDRVKKGFTRRKKTTLGAMEHDEPTVHDWIVISALDR